MSKLNQLICASQAGNTGLPASCTHNPDQIIGLIAVPAATVFTAAQLADFQTTLQEAFLEDVYKDRSHRFGPFEEVDDQSEDRQQQTFGFGRKITTRDEVYYWEYQYIDGAMCAHKSYTQFNNREREYRFLLVDKSRNIIGTEGTDASGFTGLRGVAITEFRAKRWKQKDGTNETMYKLAIGVKDASELNERYAYVTVEFDVFDLDLIQDAQLSALSTLNGGAVNIAVTAGCGGQNLVQLFGSDLADLTLFDCNHEDGGVIDIDGITIGGVDENSYLIFNLDETDTEYPLSTEKLRIKMKARSVLTAAGISYYESNRLTLTEV